MHKYSFIKKEYLKSPLNNEKLWLQYFKSVFGYSMYLLDLFQFISNDPIIH